MRRLVVASTALLAMVGAAVVGSYLLLFSVVPDRASRAAPADTALYVSLYLQPSSGQKVDLLGLIGRLPGFGDVATVEQKLHEVAQRLFGQAGIDYETDVRTWLGGEVALAIVPADPGSPASGVVLLATVRDPVAARAALPRLMVGTADTYAAQSYRGRQTMVGQSRSYVLLDDLLLVADSPALLHAAMDADGDATPSLADAPSFVAAMRSVPADHVGSIYVDLPRLATLGSGETLGGYTTAALVVTAEPDGLHLDGSASFDRSAAGSGSIAAFDLSGQASGLSRWMPDTVRAEVALGGLQQSLHDLEGQLKADPAFAPAAEALNQLRAIAAVGLGINADRDLLPLFDGQAALAVEDLDPGAPRGLLLLEPNDGEAAGAALDRMRDGLRGRGATVATTQAQGALITTVTIPAIGRVAYSVVDGVVLAGLDPADVAAALDAHANGRTLAADDRYAKAFQLAGAHAGTEIWADIPGLVEAASGIFDPGGELRDILHQIGVLALSAAAEDDRLEIHAVLTVP